MPLVVMIARPLSRIISGVKTDEKGFHLFDIGEDQSTQDVLIPSMSDAMPTDYT